MTTPIDSSFDPGVKSALICIDDPDVLGEVVEQISDIGFRPCTGISLEDLLYKMQANIYELILIAENVGDTDLGSNPILAETLRIPVNQRHGQVVVLIGPSFSSGDEGQAYQFSVDQVIGQKDIANLRPLLRRAVARAQEFYGRYIEAIAAADKA